MPLYNLQSASELPRSFTHWHDESEILTGNGFTYDNGTAYTFGTVVYQHPASVGDSFRFFRLLKAGNYRLFLRCQRGGNRGILRLDLNNNMLFNDWDMVGGFAMDTLTKDITITTDGLHEFKFTIAGKNNSSSNFYALLTKFWAYQI